MFVTALKEITYWNELYVQNVIFGWYFWLLCFNYSFVENIYTFDQKNHSILQAILGKIERALEMKLRGKDKGKPLAPGPKKAQAK